MSAEVAAFLVAGAAAGGLINGLAGFGTSLFALGWWLQVMPPVQAVAIALAVSAATGLQGVAVVRRSIEWRRLALFLVPALFGIPIGATLLKDLDPTPLKIAIGAFLLIYGAFFTVRRNLPKLTRPYPAVDATLGFVSGILGAVAGLSGALPTMWLAMRDWTKGRTRGVLQPFNVIVLGISAVLLAVAGAYDRGTLILLAVALAVSMLAAQCGIALFQRLSDTAFRRLIIALMFASGATILVREVL
ncbi:sulfite exporter TauE/SafE family protein [Acuticoccus sp.]|uniref:sulfite exporter TauE/SafE family protein n=1 Tax=Acuticoccus sp. TaxID=1904378 RepID=UPI003B520272